MHSFLKEGTFASHTNQKKKKKKSLHESKIGKARKKAGYTISILTTLMILMAGITRWMGTAEMVQNFASMTNWSDKMAFIGALELVIIALYWIPKKMNTGFFLMLGFMGDELFAEVLLKGKLPIPAMFVYSKNGRFVENS